jgi:hypothetical protein
MPHQGLAGLGNLNVVGLQRFGGMLRRLEMIDLIMNLTPDIVNLVSIVQMCTMLTELAWNPFRCACISSVGSSEPLGLTSLGAIGVVPLLVVVPGWRT